MGLDVITEEFYKPLKRDWRGYVDISAKEISPGAISNPDYFSADPQRRVKYEFANTINYSFLQGSTDKISSYGNPKTEIYRTDLPLVKQDSLL